MTHKTNPNLCPECKGRKLIIVNGFYEADCPTCKSQGEILPDVCKTCNGTKWVICGCFESACPDCR